VDFLWVIRYISKKVCSLIEHKFLEYLDKGYGHVDEKLYYPVYFKHSDLFEHYYGDYQQIVSNYRYATDFKCTLDFLFLTVIKMIHFSNVKFLSVTK